MLQFIKIWGLLFFGCVLSGCTHTNSADETAYVNTHIVIERKHYYPWETDIGYSQVVKVNNTLYLSGMTSEKATFDSQMDDIYRSIKTILADYNVGMDAIVKEVIFTTNIEKLKQLIPRRKAYFFSLGHHSYPAATWVEVNQLWSPSHLLEVEVIAVLP
ncbi:RidA family protein [Shewanella surugensis]|uniref:RidA family protein n=1 Tax=Shewanella surugensis TaxID=212020 RepID=A0ABT0L7H8_9GAMM|nr:RidA family protein [Shewanella surugensis]MCL1123646.1 RidA family protein [Shewanella surugensis]